MAPQKVLTADQMRAVDRQTIAAGVPGIILMENAACRVLEFLTLHFSPLNEQRIVVFCGKGNNGGDGLGIARQLLIRYHPKSLDVLLTSAPEELTGDAAANYTMLQACGGNVRHEIYPGLSSTTLIVDALLGTGLEGPARGRSLDWIRAINHSFPGARVLAVDMPSGMPSDSGEPSGEFARADSTVTFTAPRMCHVLAPNCNHLGRFHVAPIGSRPDFYQADPAIQLALVGPAVVAPLLAPRRPDSNKGVYGHALIVAGSRGKTGAAAMAGMACLHAGAGLVTVAAPTSAIPVIASFAPELMTEFLPETAEGAIAASAGERISSLLETLTLLAIGPGIGTGDGVAAIVRELFAGCPKPMVVDADALNILAAAGAWPDTHGKLRVLTPHPGEMARLTGSSVKQVQSDRVACARGFATERDVVLVLKGERTLIAFPDGNVWVNPTGSPAMASGGTGDILTGLIAGMLAQFPNSPHEAVAAAVYLHGLAGELGAAEIGEQPFVATDLLRFLPRAMKETARDAGAS